MKNKKIILVSVIITVMALVGVLLFVLINGKNSDKDLLADNDEQITGTATSTEPPSATEAPATNPTQVPTATPSPTPLVKIGDTNPLNIDGYEYFDDDEADNEQGDVYLKARIESDAMIGDQYIFDFDVFSYENNVMFSYGSASAPMNSEVWFDEDIELHTFIGAILRDDGTVITDECDNSGFLMHFKNEKIILFEPEAGGYKWIVFDSELDKESEIQLPYSDSFAISPDAKRIYYVRDRRVYMKDVNNEAEVINIEDGLWPASVYDVLSDSKGNEYLFLNVQAEDMLCYYAIASAKTGEVLYMSQEYFSSIEVQNNYFIETLFDENYNNLGWIIGSDGYSRDYEWVADEYYPTIYTLPDGYLLFVQSNYEDEIKLILYSHETDELVGSTELVIPVNNSSYIENGMGLYFKGGILRSDMTEMLLQVIDTSGNYCYYIWDLTDEDTDDAAVNTKEHEQGSRPKVEIESKYDFSLYTPSEVGEELLPLREKADELEEKLGIEIYIGEECANIIGGYAINALTDYERVEAALDALDAELSKYPDGFFEQLNSGFYNENVFYIAGELLGVDEGMLAAAGGFQCEYENNQLIVFDAWDANSLQSTIHHELFHSIEDYIQELGWSSSVIYFDENAWIALNPPTGYFDSMYTYTYEQFGFEENWKYVHDVLYYSEGDVTDAYFVDTYSMTFPSEDRARLFESAMSDYLYQVDFDKEVHLRAKLDYLAQCIREAFDTTDWKDVPWEID